MPVRKVISRVAPLAVVGLVALGAFAAERPKSLDSAILSQSRGNSDGSILSSLPCPAPTPCTVAGAVCNVCQSNTYTTTIGPGGSGGFNYGAANGNQCGSIQTGTCNAVLVCAGLRPFGGNCFSTPGTPSNQPN
jgi:hypothetical protein